MPSGAAARSRPGKYRSMPERSAASRTVVPAGTLRRSSFCSPTRACTTSISISAMELLGPLAEGVDHGVGGLGKERAEGRLDQRTGVVEGQVQADLAGLFAERLELPQAVQLGE